MHSQRATNPVPSSHPRCILLGGLLLLGLSPMEAASADPGRSPSRLLPAQGLTSYLESDGLNAHNDAWKATAAHQILARTTAGATMIDVERRVLDQLFKAAGREKLSAADFVAFQDHLVRHGFASASYEDDGESATVFVLNDFGGKEIRDRFDRMLRPLLGMEADAQFPTLARRGRHLTGFGDWDAAEGKPEAGAAPPVPQIADLLRGGNVRQPPMGLTWWLEGDALVLVKGPTSSPLDALIRPDRARKNLKAIHRNQVSAVLDAIETKRPNVSTHSAHASATAEGRDLPGFEPSGLFFAEAKEDQGILDGLGAKLRSSAGKDGGNSDEFAFFQALDVGRAHRIVGRWGFRGKMLLTDVRFEVPDAWKGPFNRGGFSRDRLPPIPKGMGAFAIGSLDLKRTIDRFAPLGNAMIPEARVISTAVDQAIREATTPQLREDLLRHLKPTWCVYASPDGKGGTVPTFLVEFDDANGLDRTLEALVSEINAIFRKRSGDPGDAKPLAITIERMPAPDRGYRLVSPDGQVPWLTDDRQPTILIGQTSLALAINPILARAAIAAETKPEGRWEPSGELARAFECLPASVSFLSVGNPRDSSWPEAMANLPRTAPLFLNKFLGVDLTNDSQEARTPDPLDVLGIPKAGGNGPRPPRADEMRPMIPPSVLAATVEDRGFRVIGLEALPFACLGIEAHFKPEERAQPLDLKVKFAPGR